MNKLQFIHNETKKTKTIRFFFPLYPLKTLKVPYLMCIVASLIALRVVFQFFSISIPQFNMSLSLAHTPIIIAGWLFGPVFGLIFGVFTDTLMFLIQPAAAWFWLYAIQEPLLCMLSGILGSLYVLRLNAKNTFIDLVVLKILAFGFLIATYVFVLLYAVPGTSMQGGSKFDVLFYSTYKYIALGALLIFIIIFEGFFWFFRSKKKNKNNMVLYLSTIAFLNAIIFSFLLGTISAIEYYKFLNNGMESPLFTKYGMMFYTLPRIIKESIKTPIQIIVLIGVVYAINPMFKNSLNNVKLIYLSKESSQLRVNDEKSVIPFNENCQILKSYITKIRNFDE